MSRRAIVGLLVVGLAASAESPSPGADAAPGPRLVRLPEPWGPFTPAVRTFVFADPSRTDVAFGDPPGARPILVRIWYPSDATTGRERPYMHPELADAWRENMPAADGFETAVETHSLLDAPLSAARRRWPVLLFSHGRSFPVDAYQIALEDLASRGWVVAAISHPFEEALTILPDGRRIPYRGPGWEDETERGEVLTAVVDELVRDAALVLDRLEALDRDPTQIFAGRLDLARGVGSLGHSLGGAVAVASLERDDRVKAAMSWEGQVYRPRDRPLRVSGPLLHFIGSANAGELAGRDYRAAEGGGPVYEIVLAGAWHASFGDMLHVYRRYADRGWLERHRREMDALRANQITNDYVHEFFAHHLLGEELDLLAPDPEGAPWGSRDYPEVTLRAYRASPGTMR